MKFEHLERDHVGRRGLLSDMTSTAKEASVSSQAEMNARIARLEDKLAIQEIAVLYGFFVDERDVAGLREIFCVDATLSSEDGTYGARGVDSIIATYERRFESLGPSHHYSHGHAIRFEADDPDLATGLVAAHAEVHSHGTPMQVALRYKDVYQRIDGRWRFLDRRMSFMYYLPIADVATDLGDRDAVRMSGDRNPSDWPEALYSSEGNAFLEQYHRHDG